MWTRLLACTPIAGAGITGARTRIPISTKMSGATAVRLWADRFRTPEDGSFTIVADRDGDVIGFAHTRLDIDPEWGALLDNLHVGFLLKRQGVGRALMAATAHGLEQRRPSSGLYLWVLKQNTAAQAFYSAMGGVLVGDKLGGPFPGGGRAPVLRYAWPDPSVLVSHEDR